MIRLHCPPGVLITKSAAKDRGFLRSICLDMFTGPPCDKDQIDEWKKTI